MVKTLLVGFTGHQNFGDDLLLSQAYHELEPYCSLSIWTNVLDSRSAYLDEWFPKASIIRSSRLGYNVFKQFSKVLYIGGGVFFDYSERYPISRYLRKLVSSGVNYHFATLLGTRFAGIGIGIGPFLSEKAEQLNRYTLKSFDFIGVRDGMSQEYLQKYGIGKKAIVGFDLSLLNAPKNGTLPEKSLLICPRKFPHLKNGDSYHLTLIEWARSKQNDGFKVIVFGFQPNHDEGVLSYYRDSGFETQLWDPNKMETNDVFSLFSRQQIIVSSRMHGVYIAGLTGRACIGINVHPKVKDATSLFTNAACAELGFDVDELEFMISSILRKDNLSNLDSFSHSARLQYQHAKDWIVSG